MTYEITDTADHPAALDGVIYEALGAASVCWEDMSGTGVFQDGQAREIAEAVLSWIRTNIAQRPVSPCTDPHLGLATTGHLLRELESRIRMDYYVGGGGLGYTTVGGRSAADPGDERDGLVVAAASETGRPLQ